MGDTGYWKSHIDAVRNENGESSYWRGTYAPDPDAFRGATPQETRGFAGEAVAADEGAPERGAAKQVSAKEPLHYGSVSARARQAYAAEALLHKDHISAGLLAIFLGAFGIHKFYLGCNQAGFIMLAVSIIGGILTFGLAAAVIWVISAIEGIIYLSKSQTEFDRIYVLNQRDWF